MSARLDTSSCQPRAVPPAPTISSITGPIGLMSVAATSKHHYRSGWHNQGVMIREIDVIRKQEGW
jgi:hypothetical protein